MEESGAVLGKHSFRSPLITYYRDILTRVMGASNKGIVPLPEVGSPPSTYHRDIPSMFYLGKLFLVSIYNFLFLLG